MVLVFVDTQAAPGAAFFLLLHNFLPLHSFLSMNNLPALNWLPLHDLLSLRRARGSWRSLA